MAWILMILGVVGWAHIRLRRKYTTHPLTTRWAWILLASGVVLGWFTGMSGAELLLGLGLGCSGAGLVMALSGAPTRLFWAGALVITTAAGLWMTLGYGDETTRAAAAHDGEQSGKERFARQFEAKPRQFHARVRSPEIDKPDALLDLWVSFETNSTGHVRFLTNGEPTSTASGTWAFDANADELQFDSSGHTLRFSLEVNAEAPMLGILTILEAEVEPWFVGEAQHYDLRGR